MLVVDAPRWSDVVSTLHGFAICTFAVPVERLARLLPPYLEPEVVRMDDGTERALVSAVTFRNVDFHVGFAPCVRLIAEQTNFRAYVRRGGQQAVYFFGTTLGSPFVLIPKLVWRLPWAYGRHDCTFDFDASGRCREYAWSATSAHGVETLRARGTGVGVGRIDGFADEATTAAVLTHPLVGFVRRSDGADATYSVEHERLALERAEAQEARFELFERLGLVAPGASPHSLLVMPRTRFVVRLPPRRVE